MVAEGSTVLAVFNCCWSCWRRDDNSLVLLLLFAWVNPLLYKLFCWRTEKRGDSGLVFSCCWLFNCCVWRVWIKALRRGLFWSGAGTGCSTLCVCPNALFISTWLVMNWENPFVFRLWVEPARWSFSFSGGDPVSMATGEWEWALFGCSRTSSSCIAFCWTRFFMLSALEIIRAWPGGEKKFCVGISIPSEFKRASFCRLVDDSLEDNSSSSSMLLLLSRNWAGIGKHSSSLMNFGKTWKQSSNQFESVQYPISNNPLN